MFFHKSDGPFDQKCRLALFPQYPRYATVWFSVKKLSNSMTDGRLVVPIRENPVNPPYCILD